MGGDRRNPGLYGITPLAWVGGTADGRGWTQMGRVGGSAILGKSRNGNRISRRVAEALRGGIRVLCGSASLRDKIPLVVVL